MELKGFLNLLHYFATIFVAAINLRRNHLDRESSAAGAATVLE